MTTKSNVIFAVEVGPTIDSCSATFRNILNGRVRNTVNVPCNMDDATTNGNATTVYINDRDVTEIELKWTANFEAPLGVPDVSSNQYITDFKIGLVDSKTNVKLQNGNHYFLYFNYLLVFKGGPIYYNFV